MTMCKTCYTYCGALMLAAGALFLLADLSVWEWGVSWWTAAFLLLGVSRLCKGRCKKCT